MISKKCLLNAMRQGEKVKIERGSEVELIIKTGEKFKAILCDFTDDRLHTVLTLGILLSVPLHSLSNLYLV